MPPPNHSLGEGGQGARYGRDGDRSEGGGFRGRGRGGFERGGYDRGGRGGPPGMG